MPLIRRTFLAGLALIVSTTVVRADLYRESNLVSDVQGLAPNFDASLQNPWGVSFGGGSPFWVSNQITGNTTLYNKSGVPQSLIVPIVGGNPTGQVNNGTTDFGINGAHPIFIFSTLNGTINGWTGGATAVVATTVAGAAYTGLDLANNGAGNFLYAANDGQGRIDVFNASYALVSLAGNFKDPNLTADFTPYNIRNINGTVYVAFESTANDGGAVAAFDLNGNFLREISRNGTGGHLAHPWGLAIAPSTFGSFANDLLVGNEGNGQINAFNPNNGTFVGSIQLIDKNGNPANINPASTPGNIGFGLWTLTFGNAGNNGDPNTLYFTAGINNEAGGLFGSISAVPEPGPFVLSTLGGAFLFGARYWKTRRSRAVTASSAAVN
jgi:uncharacterized protein (TIGR03118 family)